MKITILALHLGYGGIEKFVSNVANMFAKNNEVEIISVYKLYDKPSFYIDPNVKITYLLDNLKPNREEFYYCLKHFKPFSLIKEGVKSLKILYLKKSKMKKAIKKLNGDVVISTIIPHNKLLSKYGKSSIKKIATEHNYNALNNKYIKNVTTSCKNLDYLVIASKKLYKLYSEKLKDEKCEVVNIPLSLDYIPEKKSNLENKEITYIGRLSQEKGVLDLIDVFSLVHKKNNDCILNVIGDGNEKNNMLKKIKEYGLENNIIMHGFKNKDEIEKILLNTSIGINTSFTESFGLSILETFSYGIPCVAFSSAEGVKEIIDNNINGFIIQDRNKEKMAGKIINLLNDKERRIEFGTMAIEKSLKFKPENIKQYWLKLM